MASTLIPRIKLIEQVDNHRFAILWNDGIKGVYRLSHLQRRCPCAGCVDERTGQRRVDPRQIDEDVRAVVIKNVGHYALRIQFTSGCTSGIFPYAMLHQLSTQPQENHEPRAYTQTI